MLESLRRGAKSWVAKGLIALLIASFAVWGIGDIFTFRLDSTVAEVGETEIRAQELSDALQRRRGQLSQQAGRAVSWAELREIGEDQRVLAGLVRDAAFAEELKVRGLSVPDAAVAEWIRNNPAFQDGFGSFSQAAYQLRLAQSGYDPTSFEGVVRTLIGQQMLAESAGAADQPAPGLAPRVAAFQGEMRSVSVMLLEPDMAADPGEPTDEQVAAYYAVHQDAYIAPERRWGVAIQIDPARIAAGIEISDDRVKAAYDAGADRWTSEATRSFSQLLFSDADAAATAAARLKSGEIGWEALATDLGQTPETLTDVTADDLPPATAEAVFAASGPGIVGPVALAVRHAVLNVTDVTAGGTTPLDVVAGQIREELALAEARTAAAAKASQIEDLRAAGQSLSDIATEIGAPLLEFDGLDRQGGLAAGGKVEGALAADAALAEVFTALDGEEREVLTLEDGGYFVTSVRRIDPAALQPLEAVRARVVADWRMERRLEDLDTMAAEIAASVEGGQDFEAAASMASAVILTTPPFTRQEPPGALSGLATKVFAAKPGDVITGRAPDGQNVLVMRLASIRPMPPELLGQVTDAKADRYAELIDQDLQEYFARAIEARHQATTVPGVIDEVYRLLGASTPTTGG